MKSKLTLYVEEDAVRRGKLWARRQGVPLSRVVEAHLNALGEADVAETFLARWQGAFTVNPSVSDDPRAAAILAKHVR